MKTAIVYYSRHHGNTKKLLEAIADKYDVTLFDIAESVPENLDGFDRIGLASGIYFSKFHKSLLKFTEEKFPEGKETFFIYTYGAEKNTYTKAIGEAVKKHGAKILGEYGCLGFDTYGPFKLVGGVAKGHPDENDIKGAVSFYGNFEK